MKNNLKPFDLEEAKAGKKVVTRNGRPFVYGGVNPNSSFKNEQVLGWLDGHVKSYLIDGKFSVYGDTEYDLFMLDEPESIPQSVKPVSNYKPFDLQAAIAGKPIQTKNGKLVKFGGYNPEANPDAQLLIWVKSGNNWVIGTRYFNGKNYETSDSEGDLVMAPEKKEGWVCIYRKQDGFTYVANAIYKTEEEALERKLNNSEIISTSRIEWEE